jgi:O-methyltransferase
MIRRAIHKSLRLFGLDLIRFPPPPQVMFPDFYEEEGDIIRAVRPWTMTGAERIYALIQAVRYVSNHGIPGCIVECGVWRGGSMAAAARTLLQKNDVSRDLYLFDTFEGLPDPKAEDIDYSGAHAADVIKADPAYRCANAPEKQVREVMYATGYPPEKIRFISGRVEETIPARAPDPIALLRLDTDWYESTMHELVHLFPRISKAGVIIIDDYGHWLGARKACDEYFSQNRIPILLNRIDYTGRIALKP